MALLPVTPNRRWRPAAVLKNFEWPYLCNGSSDPLYAFFQKVYAHIRGGSVQYGCLSSPILIAKSYHERAKDKMTP